MIRVIVAERHAVLRDHLERLCRTSHGLDVVASVDGLPDLFDVAGPLRADAIVMGFGTPARSSYQSIRELNRRHPAMPIILLSLYSDDAYALEALNAGASAFLTIERAHEHLEETVRMLVLGRSVASLPQEQFTAI